jgi:hypothetical protein
VPCGKEDGEDEGHIQLCFLMVTNGRHNSGWRRAFFFVVLHELKEKLHVYLWQGYYGLQMAQRTLKS